MVNPKIKSIHEISKIVNKAREGGKKAGLITGCFDVLHLDHIHLFRFAKKRVEILLVGVENDKSVKMTKGLNKPFNTQKDRMEFLSELSYIDYIFPIENVFSFRSSQANKIHEYLLKKINPNYLITSIYTDRYWREKKERAEYLGIIFLPDKRKKIRSSSKIIERLYE